MLTGHSPLSPRRAPPNSLLAYVYTCMLLTTLTCRKEKGRKIEGRKDGRMRFDYGLEQVSPRMALVGWTLHPSSISTNH